MITLENTKENREVQRVVASMAASNMCLRKEFVEELLKVAHGGKTSEQLRREVIQKNKRSI
jgi:hypothetical protein